MHATGPEACSRKAEQSTHCVRPKAGLKSVVVVMVAVFGRSQARAQTSHPKPPRRPEAEAYSVSEKPPFPPVRATQAPRGRGRSTGVDLSCAASSVAVCAAIAKGGWTGATWVQRSLRAKEKSSLLGASAGLQAEGTRATHGRMSERAKEAQT